MDVIPGSERFLQEPGGLTAVNDDIVCKKDKTVMGDRIAAARGSLMRHDIVNGPNDSVSENPGDDQLEEKKDRP
jgi:hypothetical protein